MAQQHPQAAGSGIQTTIEGVQPPPAPTRTPALVMQAVLDYITSHELWTDTAPEQVAKQICAELSNGMDGYELAKALDDHQCWTISQQDVQDLGGIDGAVRSAISQARKQWAQEWNIQPPHPVGTRVKFRSGTGVIASVAEHDGAVYYVKKDGCTMDGWFNLVNFEDAIALDITPTEAEVA